jgi:hypothetical protein
VVKYFDVSQFTEQDISQIHAIREAQRQQQQKPKDADPAVVQRTFQTRRFKAQIAYQPRTGLTLHAS